jgi:integrase
LPDDATPLRKAIHKITRAYFAYCRGSRKPRTLKGMRGTLIELGRVGKNKGMLPINPWATLPKIEQRNGTPPRPRLAVHEALALWRCCRGLVLTRSRLPYWTSAVQVALMLGTGLRVGDVQDAQVRGLDSWGGADVLRIFQGKSSAAARVLRLGSCRWLIEALRDLAVGRAPDALLFTKDPLPDVSRALQEVDFDAQTPKALCQRLGIGPKRLSRLRGRTPSLEPTDGTAISKGVHRMCLRAGVTPVSPHGLRRTNTDLRALVGDPTLRAMVAETDRQALGHRAGSDTMEQIYMAPELRMMRASLDGESVLRFLESQTAESAPAHAPSAEPATAAPASTVPTGMESPGADLTELVKRLGGKDALRRLLEDLPE